MSIASGSYERFLEQVGVRAALCSTDESERAARAVISVLLGQMPTLLRRDLEDALPDALREGEVVSACEAYELDLQEAFFHAVAVAEEVPVGFAKEHVTVVCQALVEALPAELVQRIKLALAPNLGPLFRPRDTLGRPQKEVQDTRRTLSMGRPGGIRPLSEAGVERSEDTIARGRPGGKRPLSEAHFDGSVERGS